MLADNVYGTIDEDAMRRDLPVNALYFDPVADSVIDYHHGLDDIRSGILRTIGDPAQRFREDPVRMLRVVRFAAKLGFNIDAQCSRVIDDNAELLVSVPPARLFEEVLKLFHSGAALATYEKLRQHGLFRSLFPATDDVLRSEDHGFPRTFLPLALSNTDQRIQQGKPVIPSFLYAVLLWEPFRQHRDVFMKQGVGEYESIHMAATAAIEDQLASVSIPRRFTAQMREIWQMQYFFDRRRSRQVYRLLETRKFRAGYDFLLLRASVGQVDNEIAEWWTRLQEVDENERRRMIAALGVGGGKRRRRPRKRKPRSA